jgi:hypothetical protein
MSVAAQAELITDDPRCGESVSDVLREWKRYRQLCKEHGGLLTTGQAAKILDVASGQVSSWCHRGRLPSFDVLGARMIPAPEVLMLYKERTEEGVRTAGGRGVKAPSLSELARACWDDLSEAGI